jgi:CubicO group peptidase (beta-lactamase class C family)
MFEPGARVSYSGEAIFWLQLVAERITGLGLDALMRKLLFAPAGMNDSMFAVDSGDARRLVYGHTHGRRARQQGMRDILALTTPLAAKWNKPVRDWSHEDWLRAAATLDPNHLTQRVRFQNAASSLVTTASDYARFLTLMMDGAPRATWQISERLRREMLTPTLAIQPGTSLWRGIGWSLEEDAGEMRFGHEGNNDGRVTAFVAGEAKRGRGLVILTNADAGFGVYQRIVRAATGSDQLSFIANLNPP